ncbi:hypothetical protein FQN54_001771 [Arachnomyces sp. PD_36]|nr:hypothetical protein FQN54_001771 [Arachnomyces sp. PD_36]
MRVQLPKLHSFNRTTLQSLNISRHLSTPASQLRETAQQTKQMGSAAPSSNPQLEGTDYSTWSTSSLISRITELENRLNDRTSNNSSNKTTNKNPLPHQRTPSPSPSNLSTTSSTTNPTRPRREINPSKYNTRYIALKFAYLGQRYNGYEHANGNITSLPTIEEELWKALRKTRLIFPPASDLAPEVDGHRGDADGGGGGRVVRGPYEISWEGCEYSKCGRTDRGVSAFGQVIGIRVRSARPKGVDAGKKESDVSRSRSGSVDVTHAAQDGGQQVEQQGSGNSPRAEGFMDVLSGLEVSDMEEDDAAGPAWDNIADELPYLQILNNVLPDDIRILAWCPNPPPEFSARFSCRERQYRYFFTQPAFSPTPGPMGFLRGAGTENGTSKTKYREGWLDIEAMREGAKHLIGSHDFRNLCKLDTSKQINNFVRRITHADIELVDPKSCPLGYVKQPDFQPYQEDASSSSPPSTIENESDNNPSAAKIYTFTVHGSAFLWHQVRHMVSILFLIGQGFESPSLIKDLLDVEKNPRRPTYELASDAPLVLWDCVFPDAESDSGEDALEWIYAGDPRSLGPRPKKGDSKFGMKGTVEGVWSLWRQRKIDEILAGSLLDQLVSQGGIGGNGYKTPSEFRPPQSQKVFYGGNEARLGGKYMPVMERRRLDTVEVQNAKYLANKKANREKRAQNVVEGDEKVD